MPHFTSAHKSLLGLAVLAASGYLLLPLTEGSPPFIIIKPICCLFLAILAYLTVKESRTQKLLVLALLMSGLGDIFLAIRSSDFFVQGLGSFLIAHLLYIALFARAISWSQPAKYKTLLTAVVIIFSAIMMWVLWPLLGALKAPVYLYISVITLMVICAIYSNFNSLLVIAGALSFLFSDATIAINKFVEPFAAASPFVWVTYAGAQILLTLAIIKGPNTKNAD